MVQVTVRMLGTLKEASGTGEARLTLPGEADVAGVVQRLVEEHGDGLAALLLDPVLRSPLPNALILLNDVEINNLDGLGTRVGDGDTLVLLAVAHGG